MTTGTNPTPQQRIVLELIRDGVEIRDTQHSVALQAIQSSGDTERKYGMFPVGAFPECLDIRWIPTQAFCGLVDAGWIATTDDLQATHVTYRITDAGRAAIA